jgi:sensor histidine kinase YesM
VHIEKERFGSRLNVSWEIEPETEVMLPPLSIQPLVENAINHGVLKRSRGGTVLIRITRAEQHTEISIVDDGIGMHEEVQRNMGGIGLRNIDRRLKQLFGTGLQIQSTLGQGSSVTFRIPKNER